MERRLTAILAADVVGYSRLMGADEVGTLAQLRRLRAEVIEPKITESHGRIVGSAGDSLLVEFEKDNQLLFLCILHDVCGQFIVVFVAIGPSPSHGFDRGFG